MMNGRSMRMSMNDSAYPVAGKAVLHRVLIDVHDLAGFLCHCINTVSAQLCRNLLTFCKRFAQELGLPFLRSHHGTKFLVISIICAQGVTVNQNHPVLAELQNMRLGQQCQISVLCECLSEQEIPISSHKEDVDLRRQLSQ